jgi:hypothetical protein
VFLQEDLSFEHGETTVTPSDLNTNESINNHQKKRSDREKTRRRRRGFFRKTNSKRGVDTPVVVEKRSEALFHHNEAAVYTWDKKAPAEICQ